MRLARLMVGGIALVGAIAGSALADEPGASASPPADRATTRTLGDITGSYQLQLAMASAGPALFRDTPDQMLEKTTAFEYGGRLAFFLGNERLDSHRFGLGVAYDHAAKSDSRSLAFITPQAMYETGYPLSLQLGLGWAIGSGTSGFASNYAGFYSGAALRYSFLDRSKASPVSVSFGLTGKVIAATKDLQYSSAFIGGQLELVFHLGDQGGRK